MFENPLTQRLADFVRGVGIEVRAGELPDATFLPGLDIQGGAIVIDEARLAYPGDLLHEAGHVAVAEPDGRSAPTLTPTDGEEMAALAWSYAALTHLDLDPAVVFHSEGYKGGSEALIDAFAKPGAPGVPLLQWYGLAAPPQQVAEHGVSPFPHMIRWVR